MSTVARLGPVSFRVSPVSIDAWRRSGTYPHAEHDIIGASPLYEAMGDGETEFSIEGTFFPDVPQMAGGMSVMSALEGVRARGEPVYLALSNGTLLGWVVVQNVRQTHAMVGPGGVGREVGFEATLRRCDAPTTSSIFDVLGGFM